MNHPLSTPRRLLLASPSAAASIALLMAARSSTQAPVDQRQQAGTATRRCEWPTRACTCLARAGAFAADVPNTSLEWSNP